MPLSHEKNKVTFSATWIKLEMSTLCEVGQAETKATMYRLHVGLKHDTDELIYETLCYLPYMQNTSCKTPDWMDHKLESRFPGEISTISDDTTLKAETHPTNRSLRNVVKKARSGMIKVISVQVLFSFLELLTSLVKLHCSCIPQFLPLSWLVSGPDIGHTSQTQGFGSTSA